MQVLQAKPNPGHIAVAELANYVERLIVITQNVDDLHERADSKSVIHLHGSLHKPRCFECASPFTFPDGIPAEPKGGRRLEPPACSKCNGTIRPGVVWFGETMPEESWQEAERAVLDCDILFSIGTSSVVWPASQLPDMAAISGAKVIQINPSSTALDSTAHYNFRSGAGDVLPELVKAFTDKIC
jgi:NAD-dependent deacetylase